MGEFRMPSLGAGMDVGRVLEWYVHPGDRVKRGDIVALVETDKAAIEVEVFQEGVVEDLVIEEGTKVPVGTVLAHIGTGVAETPVDQAPAAVVPARLEAAPAPVAREPAAVRAARHPPATVEAPTRTRAGAAASPYARRLAAEHGVDLATIPGSGPAGAVVARDLAPGPPVVESPIQPAGRAPLEEPVQEPVEDRSAAMRRAIGRAMARSNAEIPHYHLGHHVDVEDTLRWLEDRNTGRPPAERVLPAALLLAATAKACGAYPDLNGFWVDDAFHPADAVHLGVAISLRGGGLVAPAIRHANQQSLDELMAALTDLVMRARAGRLRGSEVSDPTITVTNLGDRGVETVHGIIYPPQVSLVGAGRIEPRPWVDGDTVTVRRAVHLTLAGDHRASDGHRGALFLDDIARRLQDPEGL